MTEAKSDAVPGSGSFLWNENVRFRIVHLLYLIAAIASSLATFGAAGTVPALVITGFWSSVFVSRSRPRAFARALAVLFTVGCLIMCTMPAFQSAREAARRVQCSNNLKQIALALHNYHDTYGTFPPAYIADEDGKPMHSWRVLILPFIEEKKLYDQYDFSQPWDGPANRKLIDPMPNVYACPSEARKSAASKLATSYVAVVGDRTAWPGAKGRPISEIADGTSYTMLVVEAGSLEVPWTKPDDLGLEDAVQLLHQEDWEEVVGHRSEDFFYVYTYGRNMTLADGSVRFLHHGFPPEDLSDLMTVDDGNTWDDANFRRDTDRHRKPKLGNWFRLGLFFLIAFFPTPWVWLNPTSGFQPQKDSIDK